MKRLPPHLEPLPPQRKWRAIAIATLVFAPGYWAMLAGLVALASDDAETEPPASAIAFGIALIPFVFIALAFLSEHPRAPMAVLKAMSLAMLVGPVVSAFAGDAVTGIIAGVGAGGICALRRDDPQTTRARVWAVVIASAYTFVLVRTVGAPALVPAAAFPLTALGLADLVSERRGERTEALPPAASAPRTRAR
jgi:hypothetical protein